MAANEVNVYLYNRMPKSAFKKGFDFENDDIRLMLLSDDYTPDQENHVTLEDVEAYEISGDGYSSGGAELSNASIDYNEEDDKVYFSADNVSWDSATFTFRWGVIYNNTEDGNLNKNLIGFLDFQQEVGVIAGTVEINWHEDGIYRAKVVTE